MLAEFVVPAAAPASFFPIEVRAGVEGLEVPGAWLGGSAALVHGRGWDGILASPRPLPLQMRRAASTLLGTVSGGCLLAHPTPPPPPPPNSPQVEFSATKTICEVQVATVTDARTGAPVKYGARTALTTEGYHVE